MVEPKGRQTLSEGFENSILDDVMSFYECERVVEELKTTDIKEYGSRKWLKQHHDLSRLNLQAHINTMMRGDEYVMDSLSTLDKVESL